jgi:hypothetical protein
LQAVRKLVSKQQKSGKIVQICRVYTLSK